MLRFSLNISMLLKEVPFLDRFQKAADLGFAAVEYLWPSGIDLDALVKARERAGVAVALMNADAGNVPAGDRGYLSDPAKSEYVFQNFKIALDLARAVRSPIVHPLVGNALPGVPREKQLAHVREMETELAARARAVGIMTTVEALNSLESPRYLITNSAQGLELVRSVGAPNLKFQYDVYHMQRMEGNIVHTLRQNLADIGHIQLADVPARNQPGTGELNYRFILGALEEMGYLGYIGLEYNPKGTSEESLVWLPRDKRAGCTAADLRL
ncbi:MAG: TIM barrel protein [Anaerolineae bacterium]|nr:TIM barrel protein [Anaerolineae bacterium]